MSAKSRVSFASTGRGALVTETSATRRRIQDVLGQARAALRQSQQFRPSDSKNNTLGSKLQFQQQPQDDYWSSPGAGAVVSASAAENEKQMRSMGHDNEDSRSLESYRHHQAQPQPSKLNHQDDFGMPFRDAMRKPSAAPSYPKAPSIHKRLQLTGGVTSAEHIESDASTTSISMSTNDLRVSDGSEDYSSSGDSQEANSQGSTKRTIKSATTRSSKKELKLKEWAVPTEVKLTPLNTAVTSINTEALDDAKASEKNVEDGVGTGAVEDDDIDSVALPRPSIPSSTGKVGADDMGFSRAQIVKTEEDPHWFEKALLARGETISEAAYKAFKKTQSTQLKQQTDDEISKSVALAVKKTKGKPIFSNLTDPEYTADWISDAGLTSSLISEVDMPISDYLKDEHVDNSKGEIEVELDTIADEVHTESIIRTATELEASGMLDEIAENLHSVLDISDHPESQNFSGMSAEEKSFAMEYDEAMEDADEPLQSIFLDDVHGKSKGSKNASQSISGTTGQDEHTGKMRSPTLGEGEEEEDEYDDNTFIQVDTTVSSITKSKSMSKRRSSMQQSSSTLVSTTGKEKKTTSSANTSSAAVRSSKSNKMKADPASSGTGTGSSASDKSKSKSATPSKSKSYASTSSTTSKRLNSLPIPPEPPTSRHQKQIQNILEKEVYQKELRRIRSEKLREEREKAKLQKIAKESLERNKKTTWRDPDYTEILLPELFKYKSVSGLQAAKAKRSHLTPSINYGAPYFQMNGAISGADGTETMLAAARVESLDIPDLVREVLASNERMYRMTVEASEQMAKKAYKDKVRKEMTRNVNKRR